VTAIEENKGINRYSGKRLQFHGTPVYSAGRVFSLGSAGNVYCYDAATGNKLWEESESALVKHTLALKEKLLRDPKGLPSAKASALRPSWPEARLSCRNSTRHTATSACAAWM
jgi:hypothetical protein